MKRFYRYQGELLPSYTTILSTVLGAGEELLRWAARSTAELAYDTQASWTKLPRSEAISWLTDEHVRRRDAAASGGSAVHQIIDAAAKGGPLTHDEDLVLAPWRALSAQYKIEPLSTERVVVQPELGYGGRYDMVAAFRWRGQRVVAVIDIKTGRYIYPKAWLQCAAYALGHEIERIRVTTERHREIVDLEDSLMTTEPIQAQYGVSHLAIAHIRGMEARLLVHELDDTIRNAVRSSAQLYEVVQQLGRLR